MAEKVSVIIPTHKRSEFLQRAVDSVLQQRCGAPEIIVVDDNAEGSPQRRETEEKMLKYSDSENVLYIKNRNNIGGALSRNRGIFSASGGYITFLDDDDIYLPGKICSQLRFMERGRLDMSFTDVRLHRPSGRLVDYREHSYVKSSETNELLRQHIMHHLTPTATYMYRSDALKDLGGFDDVRMGQEFLLMLKTIESGVKIGYLPEARVIQYIHDGARISVGCGKLTAEKDLYNFKKKYFDILSRRERRYVRFRHYAVMAVVAVRSGNRPLSALKLFGAFFASPADCAEEAVRHFRKLNKYGGSIPAECDGDCPG